MNACVHSAWIWPADAAQIRTCLAESVYQIFSLGSLQIEVVVLLVWRSQVEWNVLEDNDMPCWALGCFLELFLQPDLMCFLQLRAAWCVKEQLRIQHQAQHSTNPETEVVITPGTAVLLHCVQSGSVAQVMVTADKHERNFWISVPQDILQVPLLLLSELATWGMHRFFFFFKQMTLPVADDECVPVISLKGVKSRRNFVETNCLQVCIYIIKIHQYYIIKYWKQSLKSLSFQQSCPPCLWS